MMYGFAMELPSFYLSEKRELHITSLKLADSSITTLKRAQCYALLCIFFPT